MYSPVAAHHETSISSISTMSYDEQRSHSSAPTSTTSSPINYTMNKYYNDTQYQEVSPDILQSEFYDSDNIRDHAKNFRQSIIMSDSMDSVKFKEVQDKIQPTGLALTNSPSFSALANILEKKSTKYRPSPLNNDAIRNNQSSDTIIPIKEGNETEESSPNLIQLDDYYDDSFQSSNDLKFHEKVQIEDIFKTPKAEPKHQFNLKEYNSMLDPVEEIPDRNEEIITPVNQTIQTPVHNSLSSSSIVESIKSTPPSLSLSSHLLNTVPEEKPVESTNLYRIQTPPQQQTYRPQILINNASSTSLSSSTTLKKPYPLQGRGLEPTSSKSSGEERSFSAQKPIPSSFSSHYTQRSSSLPVLSEPKKDKKKSFMSFFKSSKRSVSSSKVETIKPKQAPSFAPPAHQQTQLNNKPPLQQPPKPTNLKMKNSKSFTLPAQNTEKVAKRSTSSTSLFSAFKRKTKPEILSPEPQDNETLASISSDGFDEDFNNLAVRSDEQSIAKESMEQASPRRRPLSQISQGETLFPKSLNRQEVESIVSLERNRSISRHSLNSNNPIPRISLSEVISLNAREEGMSVEFGRESSIPDLTKSPQSGVLKKTSISSFQKYLSDDEQEEEEEQLFNVEEFTQSLEFDDIADNYNPNDYDSNDQDVEDVSKLLEFADFIDFGGDIELGFDLESGSPNPSKAPLSIPPLNPQAAGYSSPSLISSAIPSPSLRSDTESSLRSPNLSTPMRSPSPLSSPFLQQTAYMPPTTHTNNNNTSSMARPISMSFRGLKAPAFENPQHRFDAQYSDDGESFKSFHSYNKVKKVKFSSKIVLYDAFNEEEYDRCPDIATCNQLTPSTAQQIKNELNALKAEMEVHEDSRCYTHFF